MHEQIALPDRNSARKRMVLDKAKDTIRNCPLKKAYHQQLFNSNNYIVTGYWLKYVKLIAMW